MTNAPFGSRATPVIAYCLLQLLTVIFLSNGAFIDEAIYITAGTRVLEGYANIINTYDYYYRTWLTGSPFIWPPLCALAYKISGLFGARLLSIAFTAIALFLYQKTCEKLFDKTIAWWGALALAVNGMFIAAGHLATYDSLALMLSAIALSLLVNHDERSRFALAAGVLFAGAVACKYGYLIAIVPVLGIYTLHSQSKLRFIRGAQFIIAFAVALTAHNLLILHEFVPKALDNYLEHEALLSRPALAFLILQWLIAPLLLSFYAPLSTRVRLFYLGLLLLAPICQVFSGQYVSAWKHTVIGIFFFTPLVGHALTLLWERNKRLCLALMALLTIEGIFRAHIQDHTWPNLTSAAHFLTDKIEPKERLAAEFAWTYRLYLYTAGKISSPKETFDPWLIDKQHIDLCKVTWLATERDISAQSDDIFYSAAQRCGHQEAFRESTRVYVPTPFGTMAPHQWEIGLYRKR